MYFQMRSIFDMSHCFNDPIIGYRLLSLHTSINFLHLLKDGLVYRNHINVIQVYVFFKS